MLAYARLDVSSVCVLRSYGMPCHSRTRMPIPTRLPSKERVCHAQLCTDSALGSYSEPFRATHQDMAWAKKMLLSYVYTYLVPFRNA